MSIDQLGPHFEADGICPDPVFVIGSPRSGTTALGHALNRHPALWASKESYVLNDLYGGGRATRSWRRHQERVNPSWLRAEEVDLDEFLGFLGLGINAMYSSRSGGLRWVDATPLNTLMVDDLALLFPGAVFLHLVRDGRAVVHSMGSFRDNLEAKKGPVPAEEMPGWTTDFRRACETWTKYVEIGVGFAAASPGRCLQVRNEDLGSDPDAGFRQITDFLGVAPDAGPATFFSKRRINSSFDADPNALREGWAQWGSDERRTFVEVAGATLARTGYASAEELEAWRTTDTAEPRPGHAGRELGRGA
jgi:hypothetical protein